ncbi:hypothetical protein GQ457_13G003660 [Hibiscus cannabinus]
MVNTLGSGAGGLKIRPEPIRAHFYLETVTNIGRTKEKDLRKPNRDWVFEAGFGNYEVSIEFSLENAWNVNA